MNKIFIEDIASQFVPVPKEAEQQQVLDFFANGYKGKLPEDLFRRIFLPFFCRETPPHEYGQYINEWMKIAGGPSSETDLIDARGNVTITIPPVYNTTIEFSTIDWNTDNSFHSHISQYELQSTNNSALATANLTNALMQKVRQNQVPSLDTYLQKKWMEVYRYFGRFDKVAIIEKELSSRGISYGGQSSSNNGDMELIFD